jgi:thermitase
VTDNDGATGTASKDVTVTSGSTAFTLGATGYKVKGLQKADLTWSGSTTTSVDINNKGSGSDTYKVCEAGATTCSNEVTVVF